MNIVLLVAACVQFLLIIGTLLALKRMRRLHQLQQDIDCSMLGESRQKAMLHTIVKKISLAFSADAGAIVTTHNRRLTVVAVTCLEKSLQHYISVNTNNAISSIIASKRMLTINKINFNEREKFFRVLRSEGYQSFIAMPILNGHTSVAALTLYSKKMNTFHRADTALLTAINRQIGIALDYAQLIERLQQIDYESVRALVEAIELRDPYTRGHSNQVAHLVVEVARKIGLSEKTVQLLEFAGLLHDVGKIAIPEYVLQKTSLLTDAEWTIIKQHTVLSAKIIEPISNIRPIQAWIFHHHERWDGKGYPLGKHGDDIPLESRILAVCDSYSAMTNDRPYRKGLSDTEARNELLKVAGTQLDSEIVKVFLDIHPACTTDYSIGGQKKV